MRKHPLLFAAALVLLAAPSSAQPVAPSTPAPQMVAPPPLPLPVPYAICMNHCPKAGAFEEFKQCHDTCKELVPLPGITMQGER